MTTDRHYEFREVDSEAADLRAYVELFRASFGSTDITPEFLDWQYNRNPNGRVVGFNAFVEGELAAHYVTIPTAARLSGEVARGLLSINTATHPSHQKQGLFPRLAEMTYERGRELGHKFVVGVANHNSVYGFTKKLGFQEVRQLETRIVASIRTREPAGALDYVADWSAEAVRWRISNPRSRYAIRRRGDVAQILGRTERFPALVGQVPSHRVASEAPVAGFTPFKVWLGIDSRVDWARTLQVKVPRRFRPIPLTLIFRDLAGSRTIDARATAFWAMDFDAY
jgi:GNAT superfamily N-acetyltransferase